MRSFKSTETFQIGRGQVFVVDNDVEHVRGQSGLLNQLVEIDGKVWMVLQIETFALPIIRVGSMMGLLVKEP